MMTTYCMTAVKTLLCSNLAECGTMMIIKVLRKLEYAEFITGRGLTRTGDP